MKKFMNPEIEIEKFEVMNVITNSVEDDCPDDDFVCDNYF